jgi:beta-lactamase regulating signal transducer with metallopeptidase domain
MIPVLIEAGLRAMLVALTVWAGLRCLRVSNVLAQKAAWVLVLTAAVSMPLAMRWQWLPASMSLRVPASWLQIRSQAQPTQAAALKPSASGEMAAPRDTFKAESKPVASTKARSHSENFKTSALNAATSLPPAVGSLQSDRAAGGSAGGPIPMALLKPEMLVGLLYFAVSAMLLLRMIYGLTMALKLWIQSERFEAEHGLDPETDPGHGLRMRFSFAISSPVTIGSGVLLPADCLDWDREKLRIVLAHERSHIRQGDFYLQMIAGFYTAIFWFSPLGWWLKHKLSDLGEAISDRAALDQAASRASYAQVLLEFAAMPRPTLLGVAMASTNNLSHRIERLLNDTIFHQAFGANRRRILLAVLLVPVAVFAGTALIRVEAAGQVPQQPPPPPPALSGSPYAGISNPDQAPDAASVARPVPPAPPAPASTDMLPPPPPPVGPGSTVIPEGAPVAPPIPPPPSVYGEIHDSADEHAAMIASGQDNTSTNTSSDGRTPGRYRSYGYSYSSNGDTWALVTDPSDKVTFSGDWHNSSRDSINKVRKLTSGKFLWFTHEGKTYFIDDPAITTQIEAMYKPMDELGRRQEELGRQEEELGKQQEKLGHQQEQARVPTPDISKEMAELNAAVAKLDAKKGSTVSQEELAEIEGKIGDIQGRLGDLQGKIGEEQGRLGELQGRLGEQQGRLGEEQGRLGEEQGRKAREADQKVRTMIAASLQNGKARPVQ